MTDENEPIPLDDTPVYAQLAKEYAATERYDLFFAPKDQISAVDSE
jgi:hypothetical protein